MKRIRALATASILLACFGCSTSDGASDATADAIGEKEAPLARFAPFLKTLKATLESPATDEAAANALLGSGRPAAFSLQALCRIYADADPKFSSIRDDFKGLEDGIGQYDKWNSIYEQGVAEKADAAALAKLKKNRDDALAAFTKLLSSRQWRTDGKTPTRLKTIEDFLNGFAWKSRNEDRRLILKHVADEMKDIKKTAYDMKILEHGDGVHELRRDIRWVLIEQLTLNGMILAKDSGEKCPIAAYQGIVSSPAASNRYAQLRSSTLEPNACKISPCLIIAAAKAVEDIGGIKDEAEKLVNIAGDADVVPPALQTKAQAIYDDLVKNDLAGVYKGELDACKAALK